MMDFYNHTRLRVLQGINPANLKVMLYGDSYTFDATETDMTAVAADEIHGNGWTEGGEDIANAAYATVNTNEAELDGGDISVNADGGEIGPAHGAVVFEADGATAGDWVPLWHQAFAAPLTAQDGTPFNVPMPADGIALWEEPGE